MVLTRASGTDLASSFKFEAKYIFDFRSAPREGSGRDGGTRGGPGREATREPRDR